jgi:hypothetical protein
LNKKGELDEQAAEVEQRQESLLRIQDAGSYQNSVAGGGKKRKVGIESTESQQADDDTGTPIAAVPAGDGMGIPASPEGWMQYVQEIQSQRTLLLNDLEEEEEDDDDDDDEEDNAGTPTH